MITLDLLRTVIIISFKNSVGFVCHFNLCIQLLKMTFRSAWQALGILSNIQLPPNKSEFEISFCLAFLNVAQ